MADEESEIRRMAEIADAINAILDADPVGDTPAQGVTNGARRNGRFRKHHQQKRLRRPIA